VKLKYSAKAHGYWLDGKRCKSPSAIAKVPDDSSALDKWRRRQTAIGLAMRPELLTEIAANVEDKQSVDAICERAMDHAGASSGRNWGSAVHLVIERDIAGHAILDTPETARVREQWNKLLADYGFEVVLSEAVVAHPDLIVAGRFDLVLRSISAGDQYIADVKTGADADKYLHAHAVQLHLYASAPLMAVGPQGDVDFEITEFAPMLPVSQAVGLVVHLPQEGTPSIIGVDIAAGGDCFREVIRPTWGWRSRKDLGITIPTLTPTPTTIPDPHRNAKALSTTPAVAATIAPDEGAALSKDDPAVGAVRDLYGSLDPAARSWVEAKRAEALPSGLDFHLSGGYSKRRVQIMHGLCLLAGNGHDNDDAVKAITRGVTDDQAVDWLNVTAGVAVGSLGRIEAQMFQSMCLSLIDRQVVVVGRLDGPALVDAA
jgi:hypothetical protein